MTGNDIESGRPLAGLDVKMEGIRAVETAAKERNIRTEYRR